MLLRALTDIVPPNAVPLDSVKGNAILVKHVGIFSFFEQCPGLVSVLSRTLDRRDVEALAADYEVVVAHGGNEELAITREEGLSFNPRVARIVLLSHREAGVTSLHQLRVALYSAVDAGHPVCGEDAVAVERDLARVRGISREDSEWMKGVAIVRLLDEVRHLHMTTLGGEARRERLAVARNSPLKDPTFGTPEGLRLKLEHSIKLQERILQAESER